MKICRFLLEVFLGVILLTLAYESRIPEMVFFGLVGGIGFLILATTTAITRR